MALDRYFGENLNVKNLNAQPFERMNDFDVNLAYERLKETEFYDIEDQRWRSGISREGQGQEMVRRPECDLAGVLVESLFDEARAKKVFQNLKTSLIYDRNNELWIEEANMNPLGFLHGDETAYYPSAPQLLGILAQSVSDKQAARTDYEELKMKSLFEAKLGLWNESVDSQGKIRPYVTAEAQLLGVLVECLFDRKNAREIFEKLKRTMLYDAKTEQWNMEMNMPQDAKDWNSDGSTSRRLAHCQLLGILAEAEFDVEKARKIYERLKKTPLYNSSKKLWEQEMLDDQKIIPHGFQTYTQLLDILVQHKLQEAVKNNFRKEEPMPETRKF